MMGIAIRLESHQGVSELNDKVNMLEFFSSQVFPELQDTNHSSRPMVKATALKFVCTFRKQFSKDQLIQLLPLLIAHLGSPNVVVHTLAAYGIERILMTTEGDVAKHYKISRVELQPLLQGLFTGLFQIIDTAELNENEHVMKCTMRTLSRAGEDVIPVTDIVFQKLSAALERVCKNPRNPSYNHYLFESIAALVRNVCSKDPSQTSQLEVLLFPPFQTVLQMDISEFTPYVFQVLAQLLEYRPASAGLGEAYTSLFQPLLHTSPWEKKGNVPGLTRLIGAYLKKAAPEVVSQLLPILGIFQKLLASKSTEAQACELLAALTTYVQKENLAQYQQTIFNLMLTKQSKGKSSKFSILITKYLSLFVGLYGGEAFFDCMNRMGAGVFISVVAQVWIPNAKSATQSRLDAKIQVTGLTRLLCESPALLGDDSGKQLWAQIFATTVGILTSNTFSSEEVSTDEPDIIEIGYDSTFSQLSLATKKPDDPFETVVDPVATFTQSLQNFSASSPGVLSPIIQLAVANDPKLSSGFQTLCQQTGVSLL